MFIWRHSSAVRFEPLLRSWESPQSSNSSFLAFSFLSRLPSPRLPLFLFLLSITYSLSSSLFHRPSLLSIHFALIFSLSHLYSPSSSGTWSSAEWSSGGAQGVATKVRANVCGKDRQIRRESGIEEGNWNMHLISWLQKKTLIRITNCCIFWITFLCQFSLYSSTSDKIETYFTLFEEAWIMKSKGIQ